MDGVNPNQQPAGDLDTVNVQYLGSKMSSKREVSAISIFQLSNLQIDLSFPPNRMWNISR